MEIIGLLFLLQYNLKTNQYARKNIHQFIYSLYFDFNYTNSYFFIFLK